MEVKGEEVKISSFCYVKKLEEFKYLYENNISLKELTEFYQVNPATIHRWINATNAKRNPKTTIEELLKNRLNQK